MTQGVQIFKKFMSNCKLSLLKELYCIESVPSFKISEGEKLKKENMQFFRNVA